MSDFFNKAKHMAEEFAESQQQGSGNQQQSSGYGQQQNSGNQQGSNNQQNSYHDQSSGNQQNSYNGRQDSGNQQNSGRQQQSSGPQQGNQQLPQQTSSKSGLGGLSGFLGGAEQAGEDGMINTEVNQFLTKEGLPQGMDGAIDAFIDKEANQYLGGNKNF